VQQSRHNGHAAFIRALNMRAGVKQVAGITIKSAAAAYLGSELEKGD
jgi:hypothetical protein